MNIEKRVNSAKVTKEDLLEVSEALRGLPEENRDFEGRAILVLKIFPGESDKCMAIDLRSKAMDQMIESGMLPGWVLS